MIQYPPLIAEVVPGFAGNEIIIPFQQNPAVGWNKELGFRLWIKELNSNESYILPWSWEENTEYNKVEYNPSSKNGKVRFILRTESEGAIKSEKFSFASGKHYKVQLAYDDNDKESSSYVYSTASIAYYIGAVPEISVSQKINDQKKIIEDIFLGTDIQNNNTSKDTIYSYSYSIWEKANDAEIFSKIYSTNEILYNTDTKKIEEFEAPFSFDESKTYTIVYSITTLSSYTLSIGCNRQKPIEQGETKIKMECVQNELAKENGCVLLSLFSVEEETNEQGIYYIERSQDREKWEKIITFKIGENDEFNHLKWKDFSIEQGKIYYYLVKKEGSARNIEDACSIKIDFDNVFLTDNQRQLKIKFNPKVSSFKETILEQKVDTIGSKYPFFFRNGNVRYKEIPISGLISYLMDSEEQFMSCEELGCTTLTTNLAEDTYLAERNFKLEVLKWLNNGEPKLFRSPGEGNYIVRLMNVSLSPNETVSNMIHNFSATGYEISDEDISLLIENDNEDRVWRPASPLGYFIMEAKEEEFSE